MGRTKKQGHTPGPWMLDEECDGLVLIMGSRIESPAHYQTHHEIELYEEFSYEEFEREQREEARANADLIAAAPDLLSAAKTVLSLLDEQDHGYAALVAAIARAEGGGHDA